MLHTADHCTPAALMPWPVQHPFRMAPGLQRVEGETPTLFWRDERAPVYAAQRQALWRAGQAPQVGQADVATLRAVAAHHQQATQVPLPDHDAQALALALQEDFVVMRRDASGWCAEFLSVCFPSNWVPAEKLGLDFAAIHAPVADNTLLIGSAHALSELAFAQRTVLRHVWLLTPDGALAQHPHRRGLQWADALAQADARPGGRLIDHCHFRVERQTTLPLPSLGRGVFFIRVLVCPLVPVLATQSGRAAALADALASMSDTVLAYRGMAEVRPRLLDELRAFTEPV